MDNQDTHEQDEARTLSSIERKLIENQAAEACRTVYDPEIPVNIYDMGLVYDIRSDDKGKVTVTMTLTSPYCPAAQTIPRDVELRVKTVPGVTGVTVDVVWTPPWNPSMMTEAAKLELGF